MLQKVNSKILPYIAILAVVFSMVGLVVSIYRSENTGNPTVVIPQKPTAPIATPQTPKTPSPIETLSGETSNQTGEIIVSPESIAQLAKDFSNADIVFYDGRKEKNKASDVRKWFQLHYGVNIPGADAVGSYDKTFATSRGDKLGADIVAKWLPWIYTDSVSVPYQTTGIIIGENWQDVLPKLLRDGLKNNQKR